jgi:hypothetical protein
MKIVDFPTRDEEDPKKPMERLVEQITENVVGDLEGEYLLLFDTGDSMVMLSNVGEPGQALMIIEKSRMAIMAAAFDPDIDDSTAS